MHRVLVIADIRLFRDGLVNHLRRQGRFHVVGTVARREEALQFCVATPPDLAVIDLAIEESLQAIRDIVTQAAGVRVIALGVPNEPKAVIACAEAGIAGFVPRDGTLDDLSAVLDSVLRDELQISPKLAATLLRHVGHLARGVPLEAERSVLTGREREVVRLISDGASNKEISACLHIEIATVKNHVHNILEKLGVTRRGEVTARLQHSAVAREPTLPTADRPLPEARQREI